ncbi:3-phosphoshikimate 1-carboxyvinyltransferase [Pacificimonas flava]|uniref:3-phosphoshikimate 1-carboxyvinyltransferase n=1 Tax=Pacificimonas flava TaxID=1234595 RepID=UPI0006878E29|nr:3-phosphoshikimate 1-carboxyvinyltransferase [Pacificimonas flava]
MSFRAAGPLKGRVKVPGDKSISHRALMFGALAVGRTRISGLLMGEDVKATAAAMGALGAVITFGADDVTVDGVGVGGLLAPEAALDMGNSGTSTRLLLGLLSSHPLTATFIGDASLSRRPMGRVITPLEEIGARFEASEGGRLPLTMTGSHTPVPIDYRLPVASAQVKSAVLLAGLNTPGRTRVRETAPTRDHSERMLRRFGAELSVKTDGAETLIDLIGEVDLKPQELDIPGDISSAAFPIIAALLVPGSEITIEGVGLNSTRTGLLDALRLMGADVAVSERDTGPSEEPQGDIRVRAGRLKGADIPAALAPRMIDEYPILMVAAALADGVTVMRGLEELRVKESDRLALMAKGLTACGAECELLSDGIAITGSGGAPLSGGAQIDADLDHRIAMSFAVLGLAASRPVVVDDASPIATSFPGFTELFETMGASSDHGQHENHSAEPA